MVWEAEFERNRHREHSAEKETRSFRWLQGAADPSRLRADPGSRLPPCDQCLCEWLPHQAALPEVQGLLKSAGAKPCPTAPRSRPSSPDQLLGLSPVPPDSNGGVRHPPLAATSRGHHAHRSGRRRQASSLGRGAPWDTDTQRPGTRGRDRRGPPPTVPPLGLEGPCPQIGHRVCAELPALGPRCAPVGRPGAEPSLPSFLPACLPAFLPSFPPSFLPQCAGQATPSRHLIPWPSQPSELPQD
ncbi:PREDICTED: uncharacterized protein LOC106148586 [Chinchilla lanigera]|uniref:uncharacterized protein LOC106148586 n=1 Tax=Chinchilla lanigera TaxID=34839 RepID=UPI000697261B|nr:PREDICTED: uncharacterized protein LOC106148586 [Chinchilla lanigera]